MFVYEKEAIHRISFFSTNSMQQLKIVQTSAAAARACTSTMQPPSSNCLRELHSNTEKNHYKQYDDACRKPWESVIKCI